MGLILVLMILVSAPYKEIYDHFELNLESITKKIKEKL